MTAPDSGGQPGGAAPPNPPGDPAGGGAPPAPGGDDPGAVFTQDQVNTLLRSERAKAAARYPDYDQIKQRLADLEAVGQSELEKANAKAKASELKADAATQRADKLVVRAAVVSEAARQGAIDPEIVVALLGDSLRVGDDGAVEGDVPALVKTLLEERPFLKVANGSTPPRMGVIDAGAHSRPGAGKSDSQQMDELIRKGR
jgi:hypothetical protein